MSPALGRPVAETLGPLALTERFTGPWLGVPSAAIPEAASVVLAGDPKAPGIWRSIDCDAPITTGPIETARLIPLADFTIGVTLYKHTRVISLVKRGISRARRHGHPAGGAVDWAGPRVERIRIARTLWPLVEEAAKDCNMALVARGVPRGCAFSDDLHDLTIGSARGG